MFSALRKAAFFRKVHQLYLLNIQKPALIVLLSLDDNVNEVSGISHATLVGDIA